MLSPHCSDDALNDWIDGRLDAHARESVTRHCATCDACAGRAAALRRVVSAAHRAPAELMPPDPDALERAIAAAIHRPTERPTLHVASQTAQAAPKRAMATVWRIAAVRIAAVLALMAMTAAITARLVRRAPPAVAVTRDSTPVEIPAPVQPAADVAALRVETDRTLAVLRAAAATGDRVLAAETLRALERSLTTIDAAIAEADAALARDPGNAVLAELLTRTYARKRELVRRGASLGSRS